MMTDREKRKTLESEKCIFVDEAKEARKFNLLDWKAEIATDEHGCTIRVSFYLTR